MKVTISQANIVALLQKVQGVISTKPPVTILSNILLQAKEDELLLFATDTKQSIVARIDAEVEEEGSIVLPPKRLFPLLREISSPLIHIQTMHNEQTKITAGTSSFVLAGLSCNDFPQMPSFHEGVEIVLPTHVFRTMLAKTVFAAAKEDARPLYNSVFLETRNQTTTATGADGRKLAKISTSTPSTGSWQGSILIPSYAATELLSILDPEEGHTVSLFLQEDRLSLELGAISFSCQLLTGQYPNMERIIPDTTQIPIPIHKEELSCLLRQLCLFLTPDRNAVQFAFTPGELTLSIATGSTGDAKVSMPIDYTGKEVHVAFHPGVLLEVLRHQETEVVDFRVKDAYTPGLFSSEGSLFVVMPMRLES